MLFCIISASGQQGCIASFILGLGSGHLLMSKLHREGGGSPGKKQPQMDDLILLKMCWMEHSYELSNRLALFIINSVRRIHI